MLIGKALVKLVTCTYFTEPSLGSFVFSLWLAHIRNGLKLNSSVTYLNKIFYRHVLHHERYN